MNRNIIIVGPAHPLRGGLASFNERMAQAFTEAGDTVSLYSFSLQYPSFLFPGKTQYSDAPPPDGIQILTRINAINPINWIRIGNEIRKKKPDLLILRYWIPFMAPCLGTIARIVALNRHTRIVPITDNVIPHERRFFDAILSRYFIKSCHGFVAMSKAVLDDIHQFDTSRPRRFYPHPLYDNYGTAISREEACARLGLDPGYRYLLFFGFIRDYKGLDILLKAFAMTSHIHPPLKLLIAGEFYTPAAPYLSLIDKLGLNERIVLHDTFIRNDEVPAWFCAADAVVQPYKTATQSGVTQIAYYFDKPMIITNVGGLAEMVPDGKAGFVTKPEPAAIADAICRLYDENLMESFSENVKTEKQKFSWKGLVSTFHEFLG
jgi:glycosyltransferase involved in cell wall biosynthesis